MRWTGPVGVVTSLLRRIKVDAERTVVLVCGPKILNHVAAWNFLQLHVPPDNVYVSLERNMNCGFGRCGHCQYGSKFMCKDGPVFCFSEVADIFGKDQIYIDRGTFMPAPQDTDSQASAKAKTGGLKFSSCDGCQLQLLNLEDELLDLVGAVEIAYFLEARRRELPPPYDVGLVEGSISTAEEEERIQRVRRDCKYLIAIGGAPPQAGSRPCATGPAWTSYAGCVYPSPQYISTLETATPIAAHVFVDFELRGCPVNQLQLLELVSALLAGRQAEHFHAQLVHRVQAPRVALRAGQRRPALPGADHANGLRGLCPGCGRACYGCFGPMEQPNIASLGSWFTARQGRSPREMKRMIRLFNGYLEPFKQASDHYERLEEGQQTQPR